MKGTSIMARTKQRDTENTEQTENGQAEAFTPELVDDLPKISRKQESGVWVERLGPLAENPGRWHKVHATGDKPPHPVVNTLKRGNAAGVDPEDYEFTGRTVDGVGYVYARLLTDEQKRERDAERARKAAEKAEGSEAE